MAKKIWQVWMENEKASQELGHISDEKILFTGTESACKRFAGKDITKHVGYPCDACYIPERGDIWQGRFDAGVRILIKRVSKKSNTVYAEVITNRRGSIGQTLSYFLDAFNQYYEFVR